MPLSVSMPPSEMLIIDDVAIDSHEAPSHMTICLNRSKTDPFGAGFTLHLGRTGDDLCPIAAMLGYLARRPPGPSLSGCVTDSSLPRAGAGSDSSWYRHSRV